MKPSKALTIKKHEAQLRVYGGIDGSTNKSERKACEFEVGAINNGTQARYMKQTNDLYNKKGGSGILYKIHFSNRLMNIIR